jgi:hypothetical protein
MSLVTEASGCRGDQSSLAKSLGIYNKAETLLIGEHERKRDTSISSGVKLNPL